MVSLSRLLADRARSDAVQRTRVAALLRSRIAPREFDKLERARRALAKQRPVSPGAAVGAATRKATPMTHPQQQQREQARQQRLRDAVSQIEKGAFAIPDGKGGTAEVASIVKALHIAGGRPLMMPPLIGGKR